MIDEANLYVMLNPDMELVRQGIKPKKFDSQVCNASNGHFWLFNVLIGSL